MVFILSQSKRYSVDGKIARGVCARYLSEMTSKAESLQAKLIASREKNRAMDATIDDYRKQLDEAKESIQSQNAQVISCVSALFKQSIRCHRGFNHFYPTSKH